MRSGTGLERNGFEEMTRDALEAAIRLDEQIKHIEQLIAFLNVHDYKQNPPTRDSGISFNKGFGGDKTFIDLNEGEVVCLIDSLECRKKILERQIEKL